MKFENQTIEPIKVQKEGKIKYKHKGEILEKVGSLKPRQFVTVKPGNTIEVETSDFAKSYRDAGLTQLGLVDNAKRVITAEVEKELNELRKYKAQSMAKLKAKVRVDGKKQELEGKAAKLKAEADALEEKPDESTGTHEVNSEPPEEPEGDSDNTHGREDIPKEPEEKKNK